MTNPKFILTLLVIVIGAVALLNMKSLGQWIKKYSGWLAIAFLLMAFVPIPKDFHMGFLRAVSMLPATLLVFTWLFKLWKEPLIRGKRPTLVWVISISFMIGVVWFSIALISHLLGYSFWPNLIRPTVLGKISSLIDVLAVLIMAVFLVRLDTRAYYFFPIFYVLDSLDGFFDTRGTTSLVLNLGIFLYVRKLMKAGMLSGKNIGQTKSNAHKKRKSVNKGIHQESKGNGLRKLRNKKTKKAASD